MVMPNQTENSDRTGDWRDERSAMESMPRKKQHRGFAAMDPSKQKEIASKGGRASHEGRGKRAVQVAMASGEGPPTAGGARDGER